MRAGIEAIDSGSHQRIVLCMAMPDVRLHSEIDRAWIEILCARTAADSFRVHLTGMGGDPIGGIGRSTRIPLANLVCKLPDVLGVALGAAFRISLSPPLANFCIVEALLFGTGERLFRDQNALALISLSRAAEPQDDGAQWRVLRRPARDAGISGRNVREMSEVCAVDAESPRTFLPEQVPFEQLTAALIALRVPSAHELENQNVFASHDIILAARNASGNHEVF